VLERYRGTLPALHVQSEPDTGIYDAWNKAVVRANGEWLLFLGADDALAGPDALHEVAALLDSAPAEQQLAAANLELCGRATTGVFSPVMEGFGNTFSLAPAPFPALFIRRGLAVANPFDVSYRIAGDYDFLCRVWHSARPVELKICPVIMAIGGMSANPRNQLRSDYEMFRAARRHLPKTAPLPKSPWRFAKSCLVSLFFFVFGLRRGAVLLDRLRTARGLEPSWSEQIQPLLREETEE